MAAAKKGSSRRPAPMPSGMKPPKPRPTGMKPTSAAAAGWHLGESYNPGGRKPKGNKK